MISKQTFGRTGHSSTRIIFGSYALSDVTQVDAETILEMLLKYGVNHIDTAPGYGKAEELIGTWMKDYRDDFFLATKSRSRSYEGAWKDLHNSLDRLNVDQIDLWQMHGLTNPVSWEKVMGSGGSLEAFIKAHDEGLVRYLGITGHGDKVPEMHKQSLERFDFDTVLLPYNYLQMQKPRYATNFNELIEICRKRNVAIQTIKSVVRRPWGTRSKTHNTYFYEPLATQDSIDSAVHWSLGLPDSFVITAGDMQILPMILDAGTRFEKPPSGTKMSNLVDECDMHPIICSIRDFR
jgi:aryl-alcohol dehydrogenase-like predicted oxidoreductase